MDGIAFAVKTERGNIPFRLSYSRQNRGDSMLEGTESGADLYFEKPVDLTS